MNHRQRIDDLIERLSDSDLGAVALIPGPSLFYFTGLSFHLMERPVIALISSEAEPRMVLPELEQLKAETSQVGFRLFPYGEEDGAADAALQRAVDGWSYDGDLLGLEPLRVRLHELNLLQAALPHTSFVASDEAISALRLLKDESEIAAMQHAAEIAEMALDATLPLVRVGMTEQELASELTIQLLRAGSEPDLHFSPIVASGPNAALPHAVPSNRELAPADSLILDWGAVYEGYVSDITRTFFIREAPEELSRVHSIVQQANAAGRAAVRPDAACGDVDRATREVIEDAGHGRYFAHRTGHGIGLEAHEPPYIRQGEDVLLEAGMTFTVEPGIYFQGQGGVRIEDDVVVLKEGGRSLTTYARELQVIA